MRVETEVKIRVDSLIQKKIEEKFEFLVEEIHKDVYFNAPDRDFAVTDEALRLREVNGKAILTYKGPKLTSNLKRRKEVEVEVSDFQNTKELLENLGYREVLRIEKKRRVYKNKNAIICFDEVKDLGTFIEVEVFEDDLERGKEKIKEILDKLELSKEPLITESYLELILKLK